MSTYISKSDGVIELAHHDCGFPPGTKGGIRLNSSVVWVRINNSDWICTKERSLFKALKRAHAATTTIEFLKSLYDDKQK
jgi:hypothetical protein